MSADRDLSKQVRWLAKAIDLNEQRPDLGYVARVFTQTSLPYRNPPANLPVWQRRNGNMTLTLRPHYSAEGQPQYPYGIVPRLLLTWMTTEAVRNQSPQLELADSLAGFMRDLGMTSRPTGGREGSITRLREQMQRLFMANFAVTVDGQQRQTGGQLSVASSYDLWWSDRIPEQPSLVPSYVRLTDDFYREITERPVPVDLKALAHLRTVGPLALDVYSWLTYRTSYLSSRSIITWVQLRWQFGTQGGDSRSSRHSFRRDFRKALSHVLAVYPAAEADVTEAGVVLRPGRPHVSMVKPPPRKRALPPGE
jgi:hypothetical protein